MAGGVQLVLIETTANQRFIFATNKMAENVGASEMIYAVGTRLVLEAVADKTDRRLYEVRPQAIRENLLSRECNPPIEQAVSDDEIEVVVAASGKAILLAASEATAHAVISCVTQRALTEAPGVDVKGAVVPVELGKQGLQGKIESVHELVDSLRGRLQGPEFRFLRLPVIADCATSGLPASRVLRGVRDDGVDARLRSVVSAAKLKARSAGLGRIAAVLRGDEEFSLPGGSTDLDRLGGDWRAVVHADGNGLGQIFQNFDRLALADSPDQYRTHIDSLRRFSIALDVCTENAFLWALAELHRRRVERKENGGELPILPLVLGGDDLTVLCDGRLALRFARDFLVAFERETSLVDREHLDGIIPRIAGTAFPAEIPRLGACAGVAIVKPHFPFHLAYELSEDLLKSAKSVKRQVRAIGNGAAVPCCALDFHVHYDSSGGDLERIRAHYRLAGSGDYASARPFVVTPMKLLGAESAEGLDWARAHHWSHLEDAVNSLRRAQRESRLSSQVLHRLREAIHLGTDLAETRLEQIRHRYAIAGLDSLLATLAGDKGSPLFIQDPGHESPRRITGLLDLLDARGFWN